MPWVPLSPPACFGGGVSGVWGECVYRLRCPGRLIPGNFAGRVSLHLAGCASGEKSLSDARFPVSHTGQPDLPRVLTVRTHSAGVCR